MHIWGDLRRPVVGQVAFPMAVADQFQVGQGRRGAVEGVPFKIIRQEFLDRGEGRCLFDVRGGRLPDPPDRRVKLHGFLLGVIFRQDLTDALPGPALGVVVEDPSSVGELADGHVYSRSREVKEIDATENIPAANPNKKSER